MTGIEYLDTARQQFADANGWRLGKGFAFIDLVPKESRRSGRRIHDITYSLMIDHGECFRKDRQPVAIVGHNYDGSSGCQSGTEGITRLAERCGLMVHIAPAGKAASWYYPNHSTLLVITRPGIEVVWPTPQQMVDTAAARAVYHEKAREADRQREAQRSRRLATAAQVEAAQEVAKREAKAQPMEVSDAEAFGP